MSTPKGFPTQEKEARLTGQHATVEAIKLLQHGLSVLAHIFLELVGTDAAEAASTTTNIVATAHAAQRGDVIRFTSGALDSREVKVYATTANGIELAETLSAAPGVGDTFEILRHRYPRLDPLTGGMITSTGPIQFVRDAVNTLVNEDTVTPANNIPLPVKLTGITGDITITAQNLNVQSTHTGANPDSMQIGDGTETLSITAAGQAEVAVTAALPAGTNNIGDVDVLTEPATIANAGALPGVVKVVAGYDGANVRVIHTDAAGDVQVDLASSLPAGTNNIGDVDVLTEPATAADGATGIPAVVKVVAGFDGTDVQALHTDAAGDLQVDLASSIPAGTNNIGDVDVLTEPATAADAAVGLPAVLKVAAGYDGANVRALHTDAAGDLQIDLASALPAGTNNIGDVDVLTEPATAADGAAGLPAVVKVVGGYDGANVQALHTDAAGDVQVDLASAIPAGSARIGSVDVNLDVIDFQDTPVLDASSVNIPASAANPVQVVASLAANVKKIKVNATTGEYIGIYTGAALSEVLQAIAGPGESRDIEVQMAAAERVSLRNMANATISTGEFCIQFYG
jgi:hypothetical protein